MFLYHSQQLRSMIMYTISFALLGIGCGEGDAGTSVTIEKNRTHVPTEVYVPKQTMPARKAVDFNLLRSNDPLQIDAAVVADFVNGLKVSDEFVSQMEVDTVSVLSHVFDQNLVKDLNQDGVDDVAILIQKNPQDKKSFLRYYLFAFNDGEKLVPIEYFYAGNHESELIFQFETISDSSTIKGYMVPNHFVKSKDKFPIEYIFDGREFVRK